MKKYLLLFLIAASCRATAQQTPAPLTVEKIMQDPKWIGSSPSNIFWSPDGKKLFFDWNPSNAKDDSLYTISLSDKTPQKVPLAERSAIEAQSGGNYNREKTKLSYALNGDLYLLDIKTGKTVRITRTNEEERDPQFSFNERRIVYRVGDNLFSWDTGSGMTGQLTDFNAGSPAPEEKQQTTQERMLAEDALENSMVLRQRKEKQAWKDSIANLIRNEKKTRTIYLEGKNINDLAISPDGKYITYRLEKYPNSVKQTIVPEYVTRSGYTETQAGRAVVGVPGATFQSFVYDLARDTAYPVRTTDIPGIRDLPDYVKDYPKKDALRIRHPPLREVVVAGIVWNEKGTHALAVVRSEDNKDRWILLLDPATGKLKLLDRQRDEAWIGGPGIGWKFSAGNIGWIDENTCWFQSEATGYSHLYTENVLTGEKQALTSGKYEVQQAQLSGNKKYFYLITNQVEPAQTQFYRLSIADKKEEKITTLEGGNEVTLSPDEKWIAIRYSYTNKPWELYLQALERARGKTGKKGEQDMGPVQITDKAESPAFRAYPWRVPEIITFTARDGAKVYASVYRPKTMAATHPGVIFVHGAGYLQNVHKWWNDDYFREYMFENLLADNGYTVLDMDYRGSSGYGRDWRTGIYRHMGGKDLDDEVDGAKYLADSLQVNPQKIGIWGGSYGGFMTLMALFTAPGVFNCGAALRSVTDWAHYNDGYTANILNDPQDDSIAYRRSSPIYFADGLKGHLLLCHGMVDSNVHFQDIVRLTQKLIELGKNNWELAVYPLESHGFVEPSSWTDEYKRIFKLFETNLK